MKCISTRPSIDWTGRTFIRPRPHRRRSRAMRRTTALAAAIGLGGLGGILMLWVLP